MIGVLLADASERIVANLRRRLALEEDMVVCGSAADGERAVQEALRLQPDVAVVDAALPVMNGVETTEMLAQYTPKCGVILMTMDSESDMYRRAMLAGAREVLHKPFKGDDLVAAIHRVHQFQARKVAASGAAAAAAAPVLASGDDGKRSGRLITVLSGKGGVGKSVVATNLAVLLARGHPSRVAIVDLSLQFGDVAALLDTPSAKTIADLASDDAVADGETIREVLSAGPEGLRVLAAPPSPELADYVTSGHIRALLDELRRTHDLVVVDSTSQLSEITLEAAESADTVVIVTDFSVISVKNTRMVLSVMGVLHIDDSRIAVVANQRDSGNAAGLDTKRIEAFLGLPIAAQIPHDTTAMSAAVDRGSPVVVSSPRSPAAEAFQQLADAIAAPTEGRKVPTGTASGEGRRRSRRILGFARD